MAESSAINKSLSVLGQVIHALNQGAVSCIVYIDVSHWLRLSGLHLVSDTIPQLEAHKNSSRCAGGDVCGIIGVQYCTRNEVQARYPQHTKVQSFIEL